MHLHMQSCHSMAIVGPLKDAVLPLHPTVDRDPALFRPHETTTHGYVYFCVYPVLYMCTYDMLFVMFLHFLRKSIMKNALSSSAESLADFGLCHWVFMTILPCRQQPFSVYHNWIQNKVDIIIDYMQSLWLEPTLCICNAIHLVFRLSTIEIFIRFSFDIETL